MFENINLFSTITRYSKKFKDKLSLKKNQNNKFVIYESPKIQTNQNNKQENIQQFNEKFNDYIKAFLKLIKTEYPNIDLSLFYENLKTLIIEEKLCFKSCNTAAGYYPGPNIIVVLKNGFTSSLYHELLHCASRKKINDKLLIGFNQISKEIDFGTGLNEGYTKLLCSRLFSDLGNGYKLESKMAELVEQIVGKEKMANLYFDADLYGLVKELSVYGNEDDTLLFFHYLDDFCINATQKRKSKDYNQKLEFISKFLVKCYTKKMLTSYENNLIQFDDFKQQIIKFISNLIPEYSQNLNTYTLLTPESATELLKEFGLDLKYTPTDNYYMLLNLGAAAKAEAELDLEFSVNESSKII